jgi:hypothetical protein
MRTKPLDRGVAMARLVTSNFAPSRSFDCRNLSAMPRYDLMHWSQRVRDQQAAAARAPEIPPFVPAPSARRPAKPRVARPKPPKDAQSLRRRGGTEGSEI